MSLFRVLLENRFAWLGPWKPGGCVSSCVDNTLVKFKPFVKRVVY